MAESFGCDYCADDDNRFYHSDQIGSDEPRRMLLLRCPQCGALYEQAPNGEGTHRLTQDEAAQLYPGAL